VVTWVFMDSVYLALGSNLGDREAHLRAAVRGLKKRSVKIVRCASIYATEPREVLDQPWFLNTAVQAATDLEPQQLLEACLEVEVENHRRRDVDKGPRTLDVDIIFYGNRLIRTPTLTIPHANFSVRRFVLAPLAEIAPHFVDPVTGKMIRELLDSCADQGEIFSVATL
jgi:2-amino-4-hydroxy-6-hydroxymethyldihydropteridine diphosphokinase